jgi:uncharacterized protein YkwD
LPKQHLVFGGLGLNSSAKPQAPLKLALRYPFFLVKSVGKHRFELFKDPASPYKEVILQISFTALASEWNFAMSRISFFRLAVLTAVALTAAACNTTNSQKMASANVTARDESAAALGALNRFRASRGLGPVAIDANLIEVAKFQSIAMASRDALTHEVSGDFTSRINGAGFTNSGAVENVGASHATAEAAINSWINSPYHRENMLMKDATRMGMARADSPNSRYGNYWTLDLTSDVAGAGPKMISK